MNRANLLKLSAAAIAAASLPTLTVAYDVTPVQVQALALERLSDGHVDPVDDFTDRLHAKGVTHMLIGQTRFSLIEFKALLAHDTPQSRKAIRRLLHSARSGDTSLLSDHCVVRSLRYGEFDDIT